jgi:hypothetical protein
MAASTKVPPLRSGWDKAVPRFFTIGRALGPIFAELNSNGTSRSMLGSWLDISASFSRSPVDRVRGARLRRLSTNDVSALLKDGGGAPMESPA